MKRQRELPQPVAHCVPKAAGVALILETDDDVVGIPDHDYVARGQSDRERIASRDPIAVASVRPRDRRRNEDKCSRAAAKSPSHRASARTPVASDGLCPVPFSSILGSKPEDHDPVFEDAGPEPFLDEPEDARVTDPVLQEADDPLLGNFREERPDVGVEYVVHLLAADPDDERIQRIVLAAFRPEPIREP